MNTPDVTPQERINRLITAKGDPSVLGQMAYLDLLFTELALDVHNQADLNRVAPLLDTLLEELMWARLAHPHTGTVTYLGTGHRTPEDVGQTAAEPDLTLHGLNPGDYGDDS